MKVDIAAKVIIERVMIAKFRFPYSHIRDGFCVKGLKPGEKWQKRAEGNHGMFHSEIFVMGGL